MIDKYIIKIKLCRFLLLGVLRLWWWIMICLGYGGDYEDYC